MPGFAGNGHDEALRTLAFEREERLARCRTDAQRREVRKWFKSKEKELLHAFF